jgi:septal ring factor EnvC (AmiA/AmiB activator)
VTSVPVRPQPGTGLGALIVGLQGQVWPWRRGMTGGRLRAGVGAMALAIALALAPGSLPATPASSDDGAGYGLKAERARLAELREQLVRRSALQRDLEARADGLAREIEGLQARRERTSATLSSERDRAAALERRLDLLVPRVLARSAALRERRERAARLLADLASASRRVELDPTIRARMLAISPVLLQRLQSADAGLGPLERRPASVIAREHEIEDRTPVLMAEAQRLQQQREQQQQQRDLVVARLEQLTTQIRELSSEQSRLAATVENSEAAHAVRAGPRADQPALRTDLPMRPLGGSTPGAIVRGSLAEPTQLAFGVRALQPSSPRLVAAAPEPEPSAGPPMAAHGDLAALLPPPAKPVNAALRGELTTAAYGSAAGATPVDVAFLDPAPLAGVGSQVPVARLPRQAPPIMPVPDEIVGSLRDQGGDPGKPGVTIVAMPGQAVAAPEAGHVVFAAPFRSYGLLLIIEHQREYHTLLWGLAELDVAAGDEVRAGQIVGSMAADADHPPELHVELRRNGRPVNPLPWLAASSNKVRG